MPEIASHSARPRGGRGRLERRRVGVGAQPRSGRASRGFDRVIRVRCVERVCSLLMSKQALGNAVAGVLFFVIAIVDFTRDDSGIGVVFVLCAAVFLGLAFSSRRKAANP